MLQRCFKSQFCFYLFIFFSFIPVSTMKSNINYHVYSVFILEISQCYITGSFSFGTGTGGLDLNQPNFTGKRYDLHFTGGRWSSPHCPSFPFFDGRQGGAFHVVFRKNADTHAGRGRGAKTTR